jgi:hypothetical protein
MSKDECLAVDWRTIGYEDGVEGYPGDHIAEHRKACAKYGVRADLDLYQQGRNQGLREFCQPRNGYRLGARGASYNGVCSGELETPFLASFDSGHQLYVLGARLSNAEAQLESKRRELANIEHGILSNSVEAVSTDSAADQRAHAVLDVVQSSSHQLSNSLATCSARRTGRPTNTTRGIAKKGCNAGVCA